jgi:excisionase family DNA binding protein
MSTISDPNSTLRLAPRAVKIHEAARLLSVTPVTIRRLIERGLLKPCRALRHVLVPVDQIEALLK